jgi:hypothetical protein
VEQSSGAMERGAWRGAKRSANAARNGEHRFTFRVIWPFAGLGQLTCFDKMD